MKKLERDRLEESQMLQERDGIVQVPTPNAGCLNYKNF